MTRLRRAISDAAWWAMMWAVFVPVVMVGTWLERLLGVEDRP